MASHGPPRTGAARVCAATTSRHSREAARGLNRQPARASAPRTKEPIQERTWASPGELTTQAFRAHTRDRNRDRRLYHAVFPAQRTSMAEELAHWIADSGQRATDRAALQAIALFAGESATMRLTQDDVRVQWFPPGIYVVEQGEPADAPGAASAPPAQPNSQPTPSRQGPAG